MPKDNEVSQILDEVGHDPVRRLLELYQVTADEDLKYKIDTQLLKYKYAALKAKDSGEKHGGVTVNIMQVDGGEDQPKRLSDQSAEIIDIPNVEIKQIDG